ncbi:MAG TPA: protein kinase, partial [Myxococcota bacterium]
MSADPISGPIRLDDFEIGPLLGQGGMASVHRAIFKKTGEVVALKLILPDADNDPTNLERFRREVRAAMGLRHDNICRVIAAGENADGRQFMAMELIDGGSVRELKHKFGGVVPVQVAVEIVAQLLAALAEAHRHGVIHRDLKPANLMLTSSGVLKLVDFGIARSSSDHTLTATGMLVGTPAFMSPEQVRGDPLDGRADLFGAGLILHDLLCGRSPYHADNPATSLVKVLQEEVPGFFDVLFGIDPVVEAFHSKLTAKEPADRFRDATTALQALDGPLMDVREKHPRLLSECLLEPRRLRHELLREQADAEVVRGRALVARHGPVVAAALAFENATHIDPQHPSAATELADVSAALDFHADVRSDGRITETEEALRANPTHPGLLKRLADLHRAAGNVRSSARLLKRYLRLKDDAAALQQLVVMLWGPGSDPALVTGTIQRLRTRDIIAGVKTGGMPAIKPDKPAVVDDKRAAIAA